MAIPAVAISAMMAPIAFLLNTALKRDIAAVAIPVFPANAYLAAESANILAILILLKDSDALSISKLPTLASFKRFS